MQYLSSPGKYYQVHLKRFEEDKLIVRKAYAEVPPRVEYTLTKMGKDILPAVQMMISWVQENFEEIVNN
jgi:DNA-binding HxlR family transcriptional regulator